MLYVYLLIDAFSYNLIGKTSKFDPDSYYRLKTQWQGDGKSLDIHNDGTNNRPILSTTGGYSGQNCKITKI